MSGVSWGLPRFGCRQIAFMTEGDKPSAAQQRMLRELLTENVNSLKAMSQSRKHPHRDGVKTPLHFEDLLKNPAKGNPHGWGMAAYTQTPVQIERSLQPAGTDGRFDATADGLSRKAPKTLLAHILNKVDPKRVLASEEDVHPFSFENWSAMFNGVLDGGRTQEMTQTVLNTSCPALGCSPKGSNTGEKILLYFLGELKRQFGNINSQALGLDKLQQAFAKTMNDFLKISKPEYRTLDGGVMGLQGRMQLGPGCNYVVTDGAVLLAYRKGPKLYLNRHPAQKGKFGYVVSSEPIQPKGKKLTWVELPQEHILSLSREVGGKIQPRLTPLSEVLVSGQNNEKPARGGSLC